MQAEIHNCPECGGEHMITVDQAGDGSQWAICPRNLHRFQVPLAVAPRAEPKASYHRLPPTEHDYTGD